ncbi:MAG: hypothetical protein ACSLEN_08930 [Candidatus Malihini olakiniferum]
MKLYYTAGSCSLFPHIFYARPDKYFTLVCVDLKKKKTTSGKDFMAINPKGMVSVFQLDDSTVLT